MERLIMVMTLAQSQNVTLVITLIEILNQVSGLVDQSQRVVNWLVLFVAEWGIKNLIVLL